MRVESVDGEKRFPFDVGELVDDDPLEPAEEARKVSTPSDTREGERKETDMMV